MERVQQEMRRPSRFTFDRAAEHVYNLLLKKDCYPRFVRSEHYRQLLLNALQPSQKKRFATFFIIKHIRMLIGDSCAVHHVATISITSFQEPLFAKSFLERHFRYHIDRILLLTFRDEPILEMTVNVILANSSLK